MVLLGVLVVLIVSPPTTHHLASARPFDCATAITASDRPLIILALTAVPAEIPEALNATLNDLMERQTFASHIDEIHLNLPYLQLRNNNTIYPTTQSLRQFFPQPKVVVNRMPADLGPVSRYVGSLRLLERRAFQANKPSSVFDDAVVITLDLDEEHSSTAIERVACAALYEPNAVPTLRGENVEWDPWASDGLGSWRVNYKRYPTEFDHEARAAYTRVEIFRAVGGVAFRKRFLDGLWFNGTDYHVGCFWDDDYWVSFNMGRMGVPVIVWHDYDAKLRHKRARMRRAAAGSKGPPPGRFTTTQRRRSLLGAANLREVNAAYDSPRACSTAVMRHHPDLWPEARLGPRSLHERFPHGPATP